MATIQFLGVGNSSIRPTRVLGGGFDCAWQSNLLLTTDEGKKILLDCGTDIRFSLSEAGVDRLDLDGVYISHVHADHVGGLEWITFGAFLATPPKRPTLYCEKRIYRAIERSLMPGVEFLGNARARSIGTFFEYEAMSTMQSTHFSRGLSARPVKAVHIPGPHPMLSFGLILQSARTKVFWTSDCVFQPEAFSTHYNEADIILHDCQVGTNNTVHAHLDELRTLPKHITQKMILYHHDPTLVSREDVARGEFRGFATKGMMVEF